MDILEKLKSVNLINKKTNKVSPWVERKISEELKIEVLNATQFLEYDASISDRIKILQLGINSQPSCGCGLPRKYHKAIKGFSETCSPTCGGKNSNEKKLDTMEKNYGSRKFFPTISDSGRKTNAVNANKEMRKSIESKYGVDNIMKLDWVKEKHASNVSRGKRGAVNIGNHHTHKNLTDKQLGILKNLDEVYKEHIEDEIPITVLSKKYGFSSSTLFNRMEDTYDFKIFNTSYPQKILEEYYKNKNIKTNDRKEIYPQEIDIFFPEFSLGVEVNGLYWHSEDHKHKNYHLNKLVKCNENGIDLLHFTDEEILNKNGIVISMINNRIGISEKIHARKCKVVYPDVKSYRGFCENNHISGYAPASHKIGLEYDGEMVFVIGISKSRYDKNVQWELIRSCGKNGTSVIGGFSRCLSKFNENGDIITFADRRYFTGKTYEKNGFEFKGYTKPNYWYLNRKTNSLHSRIKFQKHKLKNLFPELYREDKTESSIMKEAGFVRIYDCGNAKYVLHKGK